MNESPTPILLKTQKIIAKLVINQTKTGWVNERHLRAILPNFSSFANFTIEADF